MTKLTRFLIVAALFGSMAGGAYAAWVFRDRLSGGPRPASPERAEDDRLVGHLGGDEPAVRGELNFLISTASAPLGAADRTKAAGLTRECLDPNVLLGIDHVRAFVGPAGRGEAPAYHFVGDVHRQKLRAIAGDSPSADRVVAARKALAKLADEFHLIRQPPDWKVDVTPLQKGAEVPRLEFLGLLRSASEFRPVGDHPALWAEPRLPTFAGPDGELLVQLEQFFNTAQARAALPAAKFPKLYQDGRIPPIPTNVFDYQKDLGAAVGEELRVIVPDATANPEMEADVREVYLKLERFFTAVVQFDPK
jgi:hypothetical protein